MINFDIRDGFEKIWRNIVEKEKLDVKFNQIIYSIRRKYDRVLLKIQSGTKLEVVKCGFLIWGGPINPDFLRIADATYEEWNLFKGLKPIIFTANLGKVPFYTTFFWIPPTNNQNLQKIKLCISFV